jgi:hypothetical protein
MTNRYLAASRTGVNGGRSRVLSAAALVLALLGPAAASAQARSARAPSGQDPIFDEAAAARLSDLALAQREDKLVEGFVLLGAGLASVVAGGLVAGIGHEDETLLVAGLTTAGFGAVNAGLSLPLFDLGGGAMRRARETRELRGRALLLRRDELADGQRTSAAIFALNAGLDVFYIGGAVLLMLLGAADAENEAWMTGVGAAILPQGVFLLAFDIVNWIGAIGRADALRDAAP